MVENNVVSIIEERYARYGDSKISFLTDDVIHKPKRKQWTEKEYIKVYMQLLTNQVNK